MNQSNEHGKEETKLSDTSTHGFSNDRPLLSKVDDKLNRAAFAERVADVLSTIPKGAGLVIGIHGPWGDGKTTVLNLLRFDLAKDPTAIIRDFNPWRLSDEDTMLRGFFYMLADAIEESLSTKLERTKAGAGKWAKRGRWITRPLGWFSKSADSVDKILRDFGKLAQSGDTVGIDELRTRIDSHLKNSARRIVVLIDDIDRLDKHETHVLFRLIKACADFANVCYVLAFDDVAVAKALGERYGAGDEASGQAFLEKIIQVPLKLPVAMKEDLRSLCFQEIDRALNSSGIELSKEELGGFVSGFDRGISVRLDTPRAAKRYGNALMFALPMLKGEINLVDLLLIEAVRAFYPAVYNCIRMNHVEFSGVDSEHRRQGDNDTQAVVLLKPIMDNLPIEEQQSLKSLLKGLFPRLSRTYGTSGYGSDWLILWAKEKRICSPDYCSRYFSYAVPNNDVRESDMDSLYSAAAANNKGEVQKILKRHFAGGKARRVIERLRQKEEDTTPEAVSSLCLAIAELAKHIPNTPILWSAGGTPAQAGILISRLIDQLPRGSTRVTLAKEVVELADPLWFGDECLRWLHVTDDPDKDEHNTLTKDEVMEVAKVLVERIKARAAENEMLFNIEASQEKSLLYEWWRVEGREPVQAHLSSVFANEPQNIALFLQAMAPQSWGEGDVLPRVGELGGDQLKNIKLIYDLDILADLIRKHLPGDFENPQWHHDRTTAIEQRLAEQFMFVYNKWKTEGEPPDRELDEEKSQAIQNTDNESTVTKES